VSIVNPDAETGLTEWIRDVAERNIEINK
jgi:hypothetical protein